MNYKANWIKDKLYKNNFIGVQLNKNIIFPYLNILKEYINNDEHYNKVVNNVNDYYIKVITPMEVIEVIDEIGLLFNDKIDRVLDIEIEDIKFKGLGKQNREYDTCYYVIIESELLNEIRKSMGLNPKDLYITLAFDGNNIHNKPKDESTIIKVDSDLSKYLRLSIKQWKSWNFIKHLDNYPDILKDREVDIEIIEQSDDILKIKVEHTYLQLGIIDKKLRVLTISEV